MDEIRANAERKDLPTVQIIDEESIKDKIYVIRGVKVMLDYDLAAIYGYPTKAFNQQVRRNINRFPSDFMFELTKEEVNLVKSQNVSSRPESFFLRTRRRQKESPVSFLGTGNIHANDSSEG